MVTEQRAIVNAPNAVRDSLPRAIGSGMKCDELAAEN